MSDHTVFIVALGRWLRITRKTTLLAFLALLLLSGCGSSVSLGPAELPEQNYSNDPGDTLVTESKENQIQRKGVNLLYDKPRDLYISARNTNLYYQSNLFFRRSAKGWEQTADPRNSNWNPADPNKIPPALLREQ